MLISDKYRDKRTGSRNPNSKLNESEVLEIKCHLRTGMPAKSLAKWYGVSPVTIRHIRNGHRWAWLHE